MGSSESRGAGLQAHNCKAMPRFITPSLPPVIRRGVGNIRARATGSPGSPGSVGSAGTRGRHSLAWDTSAALSSAFDKVWGQGVETRCGDKVQARSAHSKPFLKPSLNLTLKRHAYSTRLIHFRVNSRPFAAKFTFSFFAFRDFRGSCCFRQSFRQSSRQSGVSGLFKPSRRGGGNTEP